MSREQTFLRLIQSLIKRLPKHRGDSGREKKLASIYVLKENSDSPYWVYLNNVDIHLFYRVYNLVFKLKMF